MGLRGMSLQGSEERYIMRSFVMSSTNIILAIKSRRIRWAGYVAFMEERNEVHIGLWWGSLKDRTTWKT